MILLIDNYDSFTYNLYQYIGEINPDIKVVRNDEFSVDKIKKINPEKIILSPGPKTPDEAGICIDVVKQMGNQIPILGICLGHQCIGRAYGGKVSYAKRLMHGKKSKVAHTGDVLFEGVNKSFEACRYHSLSVYKENFPEELIVTAIALDDGEIMAVRHKEYPVFGLQFHPESIYTACGKTILKNFITTEVIAQAIATHRYIEVWDMPTT